MYPSYKATRDPKLKDYGLGSGASLLKKKQMAKKSFPSA